MPLRSSRRRRRRPASFATAVVAVALGAFALTYWWPDLTTNSPAVMPPTVDTDWSADVAETNPQADRPQVDESAAGEGDRFACQVASVTDGDTLRCDDGTRVRLHAVAAREADETCSVGHPCPAASAASATAALRRLVQGRSLSCLPTGQSYNRVTAICWTPASIEVNCAMVRSGTAVIWDRFNDEEPICRG